MEKEMIYEEALNSLCEDCVHYPCYALKHADTCLAYNTIKKAIEKQIPKMVKNKGYLGRINAENIYYGECPACGKAVGSASCKKWCDQCGQSLEWSDA